MVRVTAWVRLSLYVALLSPVLASAGEGAADHTRIEKSVVKIKASTSAPDVSYPWQRAAPTDVIGSGVVIDRQHILTSAHVVADAVAIDVQALGDGERYSAEIEHLCSECDLAILRVSGASFAARAVPLEIGDLPDRQARVDIYGFPEGGETVSVTSGVVSRIEVGEYTYSGSSFLLLQVDSPINPGNSGGPAVIDGKLAGISMQTLKDAQNINYLVPTPVIRHFLDDVKDGRFDGFPELGIQVQLLENEAIRKRYGLAGRSGGALVIGVSPDGCAKGHIRPGDVLLAQDGLSVRGDNSVDIGGLQLSSIVLEHKGQVGQPMTVRLLRDGAEITERITLTAPKPLVPFDGPARYRIAAGLVFQPLTRRYLYAWEDTPAHLTAYLDDPRIERGELGAKKPSETREEIVVLTTILAGDATRGYESLEDEVVSSVDGAPVRSLEHFSRLLDASKGPYVTLVFERGGVVALARDQLAAQTDKILARYGIQSDRSADLRPAPAGLKETP